MDRCRWPSTLSAGLSTLAFILGSLGTSQCDFASIDVTNGGSFDPPDLRLHFGLWAYQSWTVISDLSGRVEVDSDGACVPYPGELFAVNGAWAFSRVCNNAATVVGFIAVVVSLRATAALHRSRSEDVQRCLGGGVAHIAVCLLQGLVLLFLNSEICSRSDENPLLKDLKITIEQSTHSGVEELFEDRCYLSRGAYLVIAATVLWFMAAVVTCRQNKLRDFIQPNISGIGDGNPDEPDDFSVAGRLSEDLPAMELGDGQNAEGDFSEKTEPLLPQRQNVSLRIVE